MLFQRTTLMLAFSMLFAFVSSRESAYGQGNGAEVFIADLTPLNGSGVRGRATLIQKGNLLLVNMVVLGYEAERRHAQHIHGKLAGDAVCPPAAADTNGDGIITLPEGLPFYGPVRIPLTPFPTPERQNGAVTYQQVFDLSQVAPPLTALDQHVIVLHGLTLTGNLAGNSASLPVACGEIKPAQNHRR